LNCLKLGKLFIQ